jgi:hypothetical protein
MWQAQGQNEEARAEFRAAKEPCGKRVILQC